MNLTSPREIRELLDRHGLRPNRALGQNFLVDRNILNAIADAAEISPLDQVLEVGPGLGALTEVLLERAKRVVAVELDAGLHRILQARWGKHPNLCLLHGDALDLDHAALSAQGITCLVSNLPYSVGTRVIVDAATQAEPVGRMVVLVQREVAERFCAQPGTPEIGAISVWLQQAYCVEVLRLVKPTCFLPKPDVMSAVVRMRRQEKHPLDAAERETLRELTRLGFQQRRKQLATVLRSAGVGKPSCAAAKTAGPRAIAAVLEECGIAGAARPEELAVEQWCALARAIQREGCFRSRESS